MSGERALWCEVLRVAIADARGGDVTARRWLSHRSRHLSLVCNLAGIEEDWLVPVLSSEFGDAIPAKQPPQRTLPRIRPSAKVESISGKGEHIRQGAHDVASILARLAALRRLTA